MDTQEKNALILEVYGSERIGLYASAKPVGTITDGLSTYFVDRVIFDGKPPRIEHEGSRTYVLIIDGSDFPLRDDIKSLYGMSIYNGNGSRHSIDIKLGRELFRTPRIPSNSLNESSEDTKESKNA